jgi:4-amino-4-deoxy-L-arabinose transferase-like glycosyltransferase
MFSLKSRPAHYLILAVAHLLMTLPNLGAHSLWDMDEGVNAEAAREMLESGNWITPYYNYELRTAKPAMMYWFLALSYQAFGVNEFAARLPAVLFGLGSVLVTYEFGRRLFSASTGLLSGLILASSIEFCLISHAATPDPPLIFFFTLAMYTYWAGSEGNRRWWLVPFGAITGLAVLVKGPIGLGLPGLVILCHLLWTRRIGKLLNGRLLLGAMVFVLVAGPWYGMVALDTKGKWIEVFLRHDNIERFTTPAQGHSGDWYLHAVLLLVLFAPWSVFLPAAIWYSAREAARNLRADELETANVDTPGKYRFLVVWFLVVLVFFSVAATKLPNYVLPLYPAIAILTGRFLDRWREGLLAVPKWVVFAAVICTALIGVVVAFGLLFASGALSLPISAAKFRPMPALRDSALIGIIPLVMAGMAALVLRTRNRNAALTSFAGGAVMFLALIAAVPTVALEDWKAPKYFAEQVGLRQTDRDIRIASCQWMRHSMVFYARREVTRIDDVKKLEEFLATPRPAYLIVPHDTWELYLERELKMPLKVIARRFDLYAWRDVLVVANQYAAPD